MSDFGNKLELAVFRPGVRPRTFEGNVQCIASAAHLRGTNLMRGDIVVGVIEGGAAELCRTLRQAHEATRGNDHNHAHVEQLAAAIAAKLGVRGAVQISRTAWSLLQGYAAKLKREGGRK